MHFDHYQIRPLASEDLESYYQLVERNRERLANFFTGTVSRTQTYEATKEFLSDMLNRAEQRTYFPFVIVDTDKNQLAGFLDLKNIDWNLPKSEVGCYMDEAYAGKGIAKKAFGLFCDYCFKEFGFHKLFLRTHESNVAARRAAESCGFQQEGIIRQDYKTTSGEVVDLIYYGKLVTDKM